MSNDRTFKGSLINGLMNTVEGVESRTRKQVRSVKEADAPKYWSIKHQEWLSLDEMEYLKQRSKTGS